MIVIDTMALEMSLHIFLSTVSYDHRLVNYFLFASELAMKKIDMKEIDMMDQKTMHRVTKLAIIAWLIKDHTYPGWCHRRRGPCGSG